MYRRVKQTKFVKDGLSGLLTIHDDGRKAVSVDHKILEAMPGDVPGLQALWIEFMDYHSHLDPAYARSEEAVTNWVTYVNSKFEDESSAIFVAIDDGSLVGYVGAIVREYPPVYTIRKFGFIEEIAVTGDSRRHGIGRQLLVVAEGCLERVLKGAPRFLARDLGVASEVPRIVCPVQQRLPLPGPAQQITLHTVLAHLRDMAGHGFPAADLSCVVFATPAPIITAVPLKPAAWIVWPDPAFFAPVR